MSSGSSTDHGRSGRDAGFQPWHFYFLLSLAAATWAVIVAPNTHPVALVLLSGAIMAAGAVGYALHQAISGFFAEEAPQSTPLAGRTRDYLEQEKTLVLRSIKELEFDRAMRKVSDADFAEIGGRLRARALAIMEDLDRPQGGAAGPRSEQAEGESAVNVPGQCRSCNTVNDPDARFCKQCGAQLR
jgi:hypothetical protein